MQSKKFLNQNSHEILDKMKKTNLRIIRMEEDEDSQFKGLENIVNKIRAEIFLMLRKRWPQTYKKSTEYQLDWTKKENSPTI